MLVSSLDHEGRHLLVSRCAAGDDLLDGDVRSCDEPHEPDQADDGILDHCQRRHTLPVECHKLEDGGEDKRQEAATDRAHQ